MKILKKNIYICWAGADFCFSRLFIMIINDIGFGNGVSVWATSFILFRIMLFSCLRIFVLGFG